MRNPPIFSYLQKKKKNGFVESQVCLVQATINEIKQQKQRVKNLYQFYEKIFHNSASKLKYT